MRVGTWRWGHKDIKDKDSDSREEMGQEWGHQDWMGTLGMDIGMGTREWGHEGVGDKDGDIRDRDGDSRDRNGDIRDRDGD